MYGNYGGAMAGYGLFGLLTWVVVFAFFLLGSVYFWKQINKKK
jgi:hypothetical protein